jgi:hypothetical protein
VDRHGAAAGSVLVGAGASNQGQRLRVLQEQPAGDGGPVKGDLVLLSTGDNIHADALRPLLSRVTDAAEVLRAVRARHPGRVSPVNANLLVAEPRAAEGVTDRGVVCAAPRRPRAAHPDLRCTTCRREIPGSGAAGYTTREVLCLGCLGRLPEPTFAQRVQTLRVSRGWTRAVLQEHSGIDRSLVGRYESGQLLPRPTTIIQLVSALGVELMGGTGERQPV